MAKLTHLRGWERRAFCDFQQPAPDPPADPPGALCRGDRFAPAWAERLNIPSSLADKAPTSKASNLRPIRCGCTQRRNPANRCRV